MSTLTDKTGLFQLKVHGQCFCTVAPSNEAKKEAQQAQLAQQASVHKHMQKQTYTHMHVHYILLSPITLKGVIQTLAFSLYLALQTICHVHHHSFWSVFYSKWNKNTTSPIMLCGYFGM